MLKLLIFILFVWLFAEVIRLAFRVTWGIAKLAALILLVLALPALVGCLMMAGGFLLLLPLALVGSACGILKCALPFPD